MAEGEFEFGEGEKGVKVGLVFLGRDLVESWVVASHGLRTL